MFNIRVYGILINEQNQVLVSDEFIRGNCFTKFPGGGLELGEGTIECLKREFLEEMNLKVDIINHFYTTDFYQQSAFNPQHQIISIYYHQIISIYYSVKALEAITVPLRTQQFQFDEKQLEQYHKTGETETFRFVSRENFDETTVTLPIDKIVATKIKQQLFINAE